MYLNYCADFTQERSENSFIKSSFREIIFILRWSNKQNISLSEGVSLLLDYQHDSNLFGVNISCKW